MASLAIRTQWIQLPKQVVRICAIAHRMPFGRQNQSFLFLVIMFVGEMAVLVEHLNIHDGDGPVFKSQVCG